MKTIYDCPIFKVYEDTFKNRPIVKIHSPNWANIIALNNKNEILLIKQYRHGTGEICVETPGGLIDNRDNSPLDAAKRELMEETGYSSSSWEEHGWIWANPAYQNNKCFFFTAKNIEKTGDLNLDADEQIDESFFVSIDKLKKMLKNQEIAHSIVYCNLTMFLNKNKL